MPDPHNGNAPTAPYTGAASTVSRALDVLDAIADSGGGLTAGQLSATTGLNRVTVHRVLNAFREHGIVRQDAPRGPYRLGFRLVALADQALGESDVVELAQPLLRKLGARSGETCHLAVLDGADAVYVAKVESPQSIRLVSRIGHRIPLYCTALGKALLAAGNEATTTHLIASQSFEARTSRTILTPAALVADLAAVRRRRFAIDAGENEEGVHCIAAAVIGPRGLPEAAISISGPAVRMPEATFDQLGQLVTATAHELSVKLGGVETESGTTAGSPKAGRTGRS